MALIYSVPGKTFLAGEYLALDGGMALLAMTDPRFELRVTRGRGSRRGIPMGSPAERFMARQSQFFEHLDLEFSDPHAGAGGWGASTAQYLAVAELFYGRAAVNEEMERQLDTKRLFDDYLRDAWSGEGRAPSGADLIGQLKGGYTFFEKSTGLISRHPWPFVDLDGFLIPTGVKVPTHEHLRGLGSLNTTSLATVMHSLRAAWQKGDEDAFVESIAEYGRELQAQKLVAESTLSLLHDLLWLEGVRAAKGCGALGADVVFVLTRRSVRRFFQMWVQDRGLRAICLRDHLSAGLDLRVEETVPMPSEEIL